MLNFNLVINIPFDPVLFQLGNFIFTWHGIFMSLGMLLAVFLCLRIKEKFTYDEDMVYNTALFAIPAGILGARMLFVFEYWSFFSENPEKIIALQNGGISVWGGIIGGLLGGFLFAFFKKYPLLKGLDLAAFGLLLGQAIGRIGDLINGEHLGAATEVAWGVIYTDEDSPAFLHSLAVGSHHPATTYELIGDLAILLLLFAILFKVKRDLFNGIYFLSYLSLYSIMRFFVTYYRVDSNFFLDTELRIPQLVSITTIVILWTMVSFLYLFRKHNKIKLLLKRLGI
ncbi:MAG: prolipoprotein diacylglyceryl transferase [Dehalococcoidaceae bacterium]|nr:prolipoprotein diacylglyceryl transferase [Dehalococcoidaceae bacterium]|tara:strand:+ start:3979 stop:4830 length:852 start_codon:yes stop_codon:yes gene_type:complete